MAILRRTEKAIMRAKCGVKLIEKRRSQELMSFLGLKQGFPNFFMNVPLKQFQKLTVPLQHKN